PQIVRPSSPPWAISSADQPRGVPHSLTVLSPPEYAPRWDENATKNAATACSSIGTIFMLCARGSDKRQQHHERNEKALSIAGTTVVSLRPARSPCPTTQAENVHPRLMSTPLVASRYPLAANGGQDAGNDRAADQPQWIGITRQMLPLSTLPVSRPTAPMK